jgi:hypothetical protein
MGCGCWACYSRGQCCYTRVRACGLLAILRKRGDADVLLISDGIGAEGATE